MRIIGGAHHRRIIHPPHGLPVRPTTDKAKEALFNILNQRVDFEGMRVLDLFAGTGAISYEFASRGAAEVVAVEINSKCCRFINKVKSQLQFDNLRCLKMDVMRYIRNSPGGFDLVFADPPYQMTGIEELPGKLLDSQLLAKEGVLIMEHGPGVSFSAHPHLIETRKYSKVHFSFFEPSDGD